MVRLGKLFKDFRLDRVRFNTKFVEAEFQFVEADKDAAWELYVELLTRAATQPLPDDEGVEMSALNSVHSLFETTRQILHRHGRWSQGFSKLAIPVLNQVVRPFTTKWHRLAEQRNFHDPKLRAEFRRDLTGIQRELRKYNSMLAHIAGVEDMTDLEDLEVTENE